MMRQLLLASFLLLVVVLVTSVTSYKLDSLPQKESKWISQLPSLNPLSRYRKQDSIWTEYLKDQPPSEVIPEIDRNTSEFFRSNETESSSREDDYDDDSFSWGLIFGPICAAGGIVIALFVGRCLCRRILKNRECRCTNTPNRIIIVPPQSNDATTRRISMIENFSPMTYEAPKNFSKAEQAATAPPSIQVTSPNDAIDDVPPPAYETISFDYNSEQTRNT